jgi:hypothetical protein
MQASRKTNSTGSPSVTRRSEYQDDEGSHDSVDSRTALRICEETMANKRRVESERTTSELIEVLGNDVDRCFQGWSNSVDEGTHHKDGTIDADHEYHARQLIRAIFAFIEAVTFSVKVKAVELCMNNRIPIMDAERFLACDTEYALSDRGEVYERAAHIKLADNIRFAFNLQEKALGLTTKFDANVEWWSCQDLNQGAG